MDQGKLIRDIDYSEYCRRYNLSTLCITRTALQMLLAKNINASQLHLGKCVSRYALQPDGNILVHFDGNWFWYESI